ncbi:MAG: tRNA (adenosine(37)-N6)-dimethylallyltransferase MiaA [Verrucomicrobiales bacterium VVV1]|nr:MAG: tRNA (adenosine(37)-N6)-dimethylallyltransferase MiaA [Verrucomicrobiales bacterium VVV1]
MLSPIYLCGPTASGKTALALELAEKHDGEIVNADAFQLYRGMEILTAAPGEDERGNVPHHLFSVLDPSIANDAMAYTRLAEPVIADILSRGRTPIVTGGSGLYLKFLTHGASPLPTGDAALREEMDALSLDELFQQLQELDPVEASRIEKQNRRFVGRALEICKLTGQKASELRDSWEQATAERVASLRGYVIHRTRPDLHARIERRTRRMLKEGAVEEVAALGPLSITAEKAIGLPQIQSLLRGEIDRATCEEQIVIATRQYAKRQETWFRRETWLTPV